MSDGVRPRHLEYRILFSGCQVFGSYYSDNLPCPSGLERKVVDLDFRRRRSQYRARKATLPAAKNWASHTPSTVNQRVVHIFPKRNEHPSVMVSIGIISPIRIMRILSACKQEQVFESLRRDQNENCLPKVENL